MSKKSFVQKYARKNLFDIQGYEPGKSKTEIAEKYIKKNQFLRHGDVPTLPDNRNVDTSLCRNNHNIQNKGTTICSSANIVKLASNENPLGPSPMALKTVKNSINSLNIYPDGACKTLKEKLAKKYKIHPDNIVVGNGSDEIIYLLCSAFLTPDTEVIINCPSFSIYEIASKIADATQIFVGLKDFICDLETIQENCSDKTRLIFIPNPNNPTGTIVDKKSIENFLKNLPESVLVVFDEAYADFTESPDFPDIIKYLKDGISNVIVLRTFSKIFGLAGIRIGYGIMASDIAELLNKIKPPFNVNSLAQETAIIALDDVEHINKTYNIVREGRKYLYNEFEKLGLFYIPSESNFILVNTSIDAGKIFDALASQGIIVRNCTSFGYPTYIRVTIGTPTQNKKFINALKKIGLSSQ